MEKVKIALLDSGIDSKNSSFMRYVYKSNGISFDGENSSICNEYTDDNGHGSLCASVIIKECKNIELYIMKITDKYNFTNLQILEYALEQLLYEDINILSLSIAIVSGKCSKKLKKLCQKLISNGVTIVCSVANGKNRSYPAKIKNVISVKGFILENEKSIWERKKGEEFVVDVNPYLHMDNNSKYVLFGKCNSYACAKMTGIVAGIMTEINSTNNTRVKKVLCSRASKHNWNNILDFRGSKRFPDFKKETDNANQTLVEIICKELEVKDPKLLYEHNLFDSHIGLTYQHCGILLEQLEKVFYIKIKEFEEIVRRHALGGINRILNSVLLPS